MTNTIGHTTEQNIAAAAIGGIENAIAIPHNNITLTIRVLIQLFWDIASCNPLIKFFILKFYHNLHQGELNGL